MRGARLAARSGSLARRGAVGLAAAAAVAAAVPFVGGSELAPDPVPAPAVAAPPPVEPTAPAPASEPIRIRVNAHPWAQVEIDGEDAGSTPFTVSLAPGRHAFRVAMSDGRVLEEVVIVSPERDRIAFR